VDRHDRQLPISNSLVLIVLFGEELRAYLLSDPLTESTKVREHRSCVNAAAAQLSSERRNVTRFDVDSPQNKSR
jgi:hypothetical protein